MLNMSEWLSTKECARVVNSSASALLALKSEGKAWYGIHYAVPRKRNLIWNPDEVWRLILTPPELRKSKSPSAQRRDYQAMLGRVHD